VAGGRPNFPKLAAVLRALRARGDRFETHLVCTGQHYDDVMSKVFFEELGIPRPIRELGVRSGSHAAQTAELMQRFEEVLLAEQPQAALVFGDMNSTVACAQATAKFFREEPFSFKGRRRRRPVVIHVEAGLRSFDEDMPEEINRRLTDCVSDLLFISEPAGETNLRNEGVDPDRCYLVGNVMIDTLLAAKDRAMASDVLDRLRLEPGRFFLLTLHRPSNVDDEPKLSELFAALDRIAANSPIVFPVHPRTRARLDAADLQLDRARWVLTSPVGYHDFVKLEASAGLVLTDSGGVQEETTALGVPCLTLRDNTERPVTVAEGTNTLAGTTRESILAAYDAVRTTPRVGRVPRLWDGQAAQRLAYVLESVFGVCGEENQPRLALRGIAGS
jgi:UDP-N-acetylglucosamine 2-epimerase (non-hydrolysing)